MQTFRAQQLGSRYEAWTAELAGSSAVLMDVWGTDKSVWAVGLQGRILHREQPAGRWVQQASPTSEGLVAVWGDSSSGEVWAVGNNGTILHRHDGEWRLEPGPTKANLWAVAGSDAADIWACGSAGVILHQQRETDGDGWEWVPVPDEAAQATFTSIAVYRSEVWFAADDGTILRRRADGFRVERLPRAVGRPILWAQGDQLFAAAAEVGIFQRNAGDWELQTALSSRVFGLWGDDRGMWAVGEGGGMGFSDGSTWVPVTYFLPTAGSVDLFSVWGTRAGLWAVGSGGTILHRAESK